MKKIAAILLIAILFINWYGYRILTDLRVNASDKQLEARLDNRDYLESELIEVSIPLNVPYQLNQSEFERSYGEVNVDGKHYTYVKRKVANGTLILKCIPNESKDRIEKSGHDYFKNTNGLDESKGASKSENTNSSAKAFFGDYDDQLNLFVGHTSISTTSKLSQPADEFFTGRLSRLTPEQPPDARA